VSAVELGSKVKNSTTIHACGAYLSFDEASTACALQHIFTALQQLEERNREPSLSRHRNLMEPFMFVSWILSKIRAYFRYRETVRELSQLTDRELDDLGISRYEIDSIARVHAGA
jgi:uncharacterized protein YjiS (DUF1127 family)